MNKEQIYSNGVMSTETLFSLLEKGEKNLKILDATFVLPGADTDPKAAFAQERIKGAQFFDIKHFANQNSPLPHMLPPAEEFSKKAATLGLANDDLIVIYAQHGMIMGPARAWWMFRVFGHDKVCVLDGGLPAWKAAGLPLETGKPQSPGPGNFKSIFRSELVLDLSAMKEAASNNTAHILDARSAERFSGSTPEPRPGLLAGHIPGSKNLPCAALINAKTGTLKSDEEIRANLKQTGFDPARPLITTCGSGVTACFIALALFKIGYKDVPVYDGSWSEWGQEKLGLPISAAAK